METANTHPNHISPGNLTNLITSSILGLAATISVAIRFVHRKQAGDFWWDDWSILGALLFALGAFIITILISLPSLGAAGYHINTYTTEQVKLWAKLSLTSKILNPPSASLSRISILLFLRRIFAIQNRLLLLARLILFIIASHFLASIFGLLFSYSPVQAQWDPSLPHTRIDVKAFHVCIAAVKPVIDIGLVWIVQAKLHGLELSGNTLLSLSLLFLVGALTIISNIVRIVYLGNLALEDPTYAWTNAGIWTNIEMFLAIICACLPITYSFFRVVFLKRRPPRRESTWPTRKPRRNELIKIGSASARLKRTYGAQFADHELQQGNMGYQVICEPRGGADTHSVAPLDSVRVHTEFRLSY